MTMARVAHQLCTRECDQGRGEVVAPQYCCSISATKLPAAVCAAQLCIGLPYTTTPSQALLHLLYEKPLAS